MARSTSPGHDETVKAAGRAPEGRLSLRVVLGDRILTHELPETGDVEIGRWEGADLVIDHPSVSRRHVRLRIGATSHSVEDLGSANGTLVSGHSLARGVPVPVRAGEAIELGDVVLVMQRGHVAEPSEPFDGPIAPGNSAAMQEVMRMVDRIAVGKISVLVVGETGVGKELIAEAIHRHSPRASKPLVRLNCAAVNAALLESEWFGYERGAFTGATAPKQGLLETADGGTVLLDEVGELPMDIQAKLLRVLEDRAILRVGGVRPRRIDVRFVAATNRDLDAESSRGAFRKDLYFRLNGVTIAVPPLRDRRDEIEPLAHAFVAESSRSVGVAKAPAISAEALEWLKAYDWPGNVRELRNAMERAVLLVAGGGAITPAHLPKGLKPGIPFPTASDDAPRAPRAQSLKESIADVEKKRVLDALAEAGGNQKKAAELLGISRGTLLARLQAFGIARPRKG
jgi:transcriptional regulator with PAS, ATPase and Fis domain